MSLFLAWLLFALSPPPAAAQQPEFRTGVHVVNVPCTVHNRRGDSVPNLTRADFTVLEDGAEQKLAYFGTPDSDPITITLLLDANQIDLDFLRAEKNAAIQFMKQFPANSETAAIAIFDHQFRVVQDFTNSADRLVAAAGQLPEHGPSADPDRERRVTLRQGNASGVVLTARNAELYEAMVEASSRMKGRAGRKALIVVTDWSDLGTRLTLESVLNAAEDSSVILYPVMLSEPRTPDLASDRELLAESIMRKLAADTGGITLDMDSDHPLWGLLEQIRKDLHSQYLLGYTPAHRASDGAHHRIEVTLADAALKVRARAGYGVGPAAGDMPTFSVTGTGTAAPPKDPRQLQTLTSRLPLLRVCTLYRPFDPRGGLTFGGMENLLSPPSPGGIEDAEAAAIVAKVAETYRKAQSLSLEGVWETDQHNAYSIMQFDRIERRGLSKQTRTTLLLALDRSGLARIRVDATWLMMPLSPSRENMAASYLFVSDGNSEWMAWPDSKVYSQTPAGRLVRDAFAIAIDRYTAIPNYPADLRVVARPGPETGAKGSAHYVVLRGHGPAAGLTHEYWVDEDHHLVVLERVRDWVGHVNATLTWKEQTLNATLARESFLFTPPPRTARTADPLSPPEPRCANTFLYPAMATEVTPSDFTMPDQDGRPVRFSVLKGPVLLVFWHTWLPVAVSQLQALEQFHKSPGGRGVQILGYTDEPPEVVSAFLREQNLTVRTIIDPLRSVQWLYPSSQHWNEASYPRTPGWEGLQYAPTTLVVTADHKKANAWSGELSVAGLGQVLDANKK